MTIIRVAPVTVPPLPPPPESPLAIGLGRRQWSLGKEQGAGPRGTLALEQRVLFPFAQGTVASPRLRL